MAHPLTLSHRSRNSRKAGVICIAAAAGAVVALALTAGTTALGTALACLFGALFGALFGWSLVTSDPMDSDAPPRSYVGARSPDDAGHPTRPVRDVTGRRRGGGST